MDAIRTLLVIFAISLVGCPKPKCGAHRCSANEVCLRAQVYETGALIDEECLPLPSGCHDCACAESAALSRAAVVDPVCASIPYRPLCIGEPPSLTVRVECAR